MNTVAKSSVRWRTPEPVKIPPHEELVPLLSMALAAAPDRADVKLNLAALLVRLDRPREVVDSFRSAISDENVDPKLLYYLGRSALSIGEYQLAFEELHLANARGCREALRYLAKALKHLDRLDEALDVALQSLEFEPSNFRTFRMVATALLSRGEIERLWGLCVKLRARGVWDGLIPSAMAAAATTSGHKDEVAVLVDPPHWFSATQLPLPGGFNRALQAELLSHQALSPLPSPKATIGSGSRVDGLGFSGGPLAQDLLDRIREEVDNYVAARQGFAQHPMIANQPEDVFLDSWAIAVHNDGHERWHVHPSGWISGVYYVNVPEIKGSDNDCHSGAIEFGPYPFRSSQECSSWKRWHVNPQAGQLLLFPSYYPHRTWPTGVSDPRLCVAFDVKPTPAQIRTF